MSGLLHIATNVVQISVQIFPGLPLADLDDGHHLEESVSCALWVWRPTTHTPRKQCGRKPWTLHTKSFDTKATLVSNWDEKAFLSKNPTKNHGLSRETRI